MGRLTSRSRSLVVILCLALCAFDRIGALQLSNGALAERQLISLPDAETTTEAATPSTTATTATRTENTDTSTQTTQEPTTTEQSTTTQPTTQPPPTSGNTPTTPTTGPTTPPTQTDTTTPTTQPPDTNTNTEPQTTDIVTTSTDANGDVVLVTTVVTVDPRTSTSAAAPSQTSDQSDDDDGGGIGTGSIIGMSVAGGVAVIGVIAFFIWKFTRKRYTDFDDEPIKWPELNSHANDNVNYELPADRAKTGAGAGLDSASEVNLGRNASVAAFSSYSQPSQYSHPTGADSTADLYAPGGDPYAVPPLPHLNPNQPYRDDPGYVASQGYYDPYRGPLPQTFNDAASVSTLQHGEAIPMNNLGVAPAGRRSPGPQMGLEMGRASPQPPMAGRQSPGLSLGYGGRTTPGPGPVMSGRQSPGPGPAYGGF